VALMGCQFGAKPQHTHGWQRAALCAHGVAIGRSHTPIPQMGSLLKPYCYSTRLVWLVAILGPLAHTTPATDRLPRPIMRTHSQARTRRDYPVPWEGGLFDRVGGTVQLIRLYRADRAFDRFAQGGVGMC